MLFQKESLDSTYKL